jgi:hypothetical protein
MFIVLIIGYIARLAKFGKMVAPTKSVSLAYAPGATLARTCAGMSCAELFGRPHEPALLMNLI